MKDVYFISGLGADERVFSFLKLENIRQHHIHWIAPEPHEPLQAYSGRLLSQIKTKRPVIVGISFGGIMAAEIGKLLASEKIILISSVKTRHQLPFYLRAAGKLRLHYLLPKFLMQKTNGVVYWLFGVRSKPEKELLRSVIRDSDPVFTKWAIGKILRWENTEILPNSVSIHGTKDQLLPYTKADFTVMNGGHLMIVSHAAEVSDLLNKILK